jgi:hypothetical protein
VYTWFIPIPIPGLYFARTRQNLASDPILGPDWYESFKKDPIPGPRACMDFKKDSQYQDQTGMSKCRYQSNTGMNKFSQETWTEAHVNTEQFSSRNMDLWWRGCDLQGAVLSGLLAGLQEKVRERERVCVCVYVHFLFFVSLLFCTVFNLDNEKNIHVMTELARYRPLCPVRCLWGIWVSQDFWTSSEMGTMACTWHAPEHNGFHTMWACGFALPACRFCTMGMLILNNG